MNKFLVNISIFLLSICLCDGQTWGELKIEPDPIFTYTVNDTLDFPVFIAENTANKEMLYAANLHTNVCNDQICLPIEVNLFWDLLGNFSHFSREDGVRFTKFDHDYFTKEDYEKLQQILVDTLSALRDYEVEDLLDKEKQKYAAQVDAVTRPTALLFSNVTVPGALYTVHTLWHIVNGSIKQKLRQYLDENYQNRQWLKYFAQSSHPGYQEYFLNHISPQSAGRYEDEIVELLFAEDEYVPHYAIEALDEGFWSSPEKYNPVLIRLPQLKSHVVTRILTGISAPDQQTKTILKTFQDSGKASKKQNELMLKIYNDEK